MNHEAPEKPSSPDAHRPASPPELEARIVAWVAGEASAFEIAELERIVAAQPELAAFKREMESTHTLVATASRRDESPLRLSPERRARLLESIGASPPPAAPEVVPLSAGRRRAWRAQRWLVGLAAAAAAAMFTLVQTDVISLKARRSGEVAKIVESEAAAKWRESHGRVEVSEASTMGSVGQSLALPPAPATAVAGGMLPPNPVQSGSAAGRAFAPMDTSLLAQASPEIVSLSPFVVSDTRSVAVQGANSAAAPSLSARKLLTLDASKETRGKIVPDGLVTGGSVPLGAPASAAASAEGRYRSPAGDQKTENAAPAATLALVPAPAERRAASASEETAPADAMKRYADAPLPARPAATPPANDEITTAKEAVSTFSLHVSDVSFRLAAAALARGELPAPGSIRPEEFYNGIDYGDPTPAVADQVGGRIEQAAHPFLQQRNLVRIALKVAATGRAAGAPLRLTVLLDTSGSMEREDRAATARRALEVLVSLLGPADRLTVIGFARQPRLLVDNVPGDAARAALELIARTPIEGGTNLEQALGLAAEQARSHHSPDAQNRIVLMTDGAANLGNAEPAALATIVETLRRSGIAFDACGVGLDGLDDAVLEALTRKGDGRYYVLDSPDAADAGFARQLAGAFRPAAQNVKVQVRFNPARVARYRLIGFERHRLHEQDFRNDQIDAAELAAEEAGVAVYQIEPLPQGEGDLGEVLVRFRDAATGAMVERTWTLPYDPRAPAFDRAAPSLQLAGLAALVAEKLRGGPPAEPIRLRDLVAIASTLEVYYRDNLRARELLTLFQQLRRQLRE